MPTPQNFSKHLARLQRRLDWLGARGRRLTRWRQGAFLAGAALTTLAVAWAGPVGWFAAVLGLLGFGAVVAAHRRLARAQRQLRGWLEIQALQRARVALDWAALPPARFEALSEHPYAADLHMLGPRSLHRLMDTAATEGGSQRLRDWLLQPLDAPQTIAKRQVLVRELATAARFRDRLGLRAREVSGDGTLWHGDGLIAWLEQATPTVHSAVLWALGALAVTNAALWVGQQLGGWGAWWPWTLLAYVAIYLALMPRVGPLLAEASALERTVGRFAAAFSQLEAWNYRRMPLTARLLQPFLGTTRPSVQVRRVARVASATSVRGNPLMWLLLNLTLPWDVFWLVQFQRAKRALAEVLPLWLETWYELEASCSMANFTHLNPDYAFPNVRAHAEGKPVLDAKALGHPLLPRAQKVHNDVRLGGLGRVMIVTGSNMSGKSTFLRTLGVAAVLAHVGAPVDAARFEIALTRVFTCVQVSDSLADGVSYFYAEVKRLKRLLDALREPKPLPLLFFIDEIFRGTNNRERRRGGRAYVRALVGQRGAGVISTHDLELAEELPQLSSAHFCEHLEGNRMAFDYMLRPGPCPTTNALAIMRQAGLPVDEAD